MYSNCDNVNNMDDANKNIYDENRSHNTKDHNKNNNSKIEYYYRHPQGCPSRGSDHGVPLLS